MPRFDACPPRFQRCVSTLNDTGYSAFDPVPFSGTQQEALTAIRAVVASFPNTEIVEEDGNYLRTTFTSAIMRFTDTVEFEVDPEASVIHFRSRSVPYALYDFGANRKRMAEVTERLEARLG